jgi:hypothetical protein
MLMVYLNYPMSRVSVHHDPNCSTIRVMNKPNQRICRINARSISAELENFKQKRYRFQATAELNDMWLEIDFTDEEFEMDVLRRIHRLLGQHYKPFRDCRIEVHC